MRLTVVDILLSMTLNRANWQQYLRMCVINPWDVDAKCLCSQTMKHSANRKNQNPVKWTPWKWSSQANGAMMVWTFMCMFDHRFANSCLAYLCRSCETSVMNTTLWWLQHCHVAFCKQDKLFSNTWQLSHPSCLTQIKY